MLNIAVCGKFHYPKYLKYLNDDGILKNFFCSYKINSKFELPSYKITNKFFKEYCLNLHLKTFGEVGLQTMLPVYHSIWEKSVIKTFVPASINQFLIHGNCGKLITLCRADKRIVVGEAVNAHPLFQDKILHEESLKRKIPYKRNEGNIAKMLEEFKNIDYLLTPSNFVRSTFLAHGFHEKKIIKVGYGVERPNLSGEPIIKNKKNSEKAKIKILCVGQVMPRKGQYYLIKAIKSLNAKCHNISFELTLVGRQDPDYLTLLKELYADFQHISHVAAEQMLEFMRKFDIFIAPSLEDGFAVVVSEALSAGLPVIVTKNVGAADIVVDGENGVIIEAGDYREIENAVNRVLDERLVGKIGDLPTWRDYADELRLHYQRISDQ